MKGLPMMRFPSRRQTGAVSHVNDAASAECDSGAWRATTSHCSTAWPLSGLYSSGVGVNEYRPRYASTASGLTFGASGTMCEVIS